MNRDGSITVAYLPTFELASCFACLLNEQYAMRYYIDYHLISFQECGQGWGIRIRHPERSHPPCSEDSLTPMFRGFRYVVENGNVPLPSGKALWKLGTPRLVQIGYEFALKFALPHLEGKARARQ